MKKSFLSIAAAALVIGLMPACKKTTTTEKPVVSTPAYQVGQAISPGNLGAGSYKGTMTSGNTYNLTGDFVINPGDTVLLQSGVTVCVSPGVSVIVRGVLISLGTQAAPNKFSCCSATKIDQIGNPVTSDPAYQGLWTGIECDTCCTLLDLQWTRVEFVGGTFSVTEPCVGCTSGTTAFGILFQNPKGDMIITDSWLYGTVDDGMRIQQGRIYIARNTLEKMGYLGGDGVNAKHGSQGDMCYNLCIGNATNSTKCSDKGSGSYVQCNINMYNNTYVDCGYRQASPSSRGSDIDYEQGGRGLCYNNLIVNCRNGIRIGDGQNSIPMPDTTNTIYGNNYIYADSVLEVNQFYPVVAGTWTRPTAYVYPTAVQFALPAGFYDPSSTVNGGDDLAYNDPSLASANNPMFVNFPLPEPIPAGGNLSDISSLETGAAVTGSNYNFHLQASSPAIGAGYTAFKPFANIINPVTSDVTNPNFAPVISQPGQDIGCYQMSGAGNAH
jgi:hypothetical protein